LAERPNSGRFSRPAGTGLQKGGRDENVLERERPADSAKSKQLSDIMDGRFFDSPHMTSKRKLIGLAVFAFACLAVLVPTILDHVFAVHPTPGMESAFLRSYNPESTVEQFQLKASGSQWNSHMSATAGRRFASHQSAFHGQFAIDPKDWMPLMTSVSGNLSAQLSRYDAQILSQSGDSRDGFHFDYKVGKSLGSVVISPLRIGSGQGGSTDKLQVVLDVSVEERWFRTEHGLITVRISDRTH
jgi:hypothetical protein